MSVTSSIARDVTAAWVAAGVKLPSPVTKALAKLENVEYVDTRPPAVSTDFDDAKFAVRELAFALAVGGRTTPTTLAPAETAKSMIAEALASEILATLRASVNDTISSITPAFEAAAAAYTDAVADLPEDISSDGFMRSGGFESYTRALSAAEELIKFDDFVASLPKLSGGIGTSSPALRITSPRDTDDYRALISAPATQAVAVQLNPVWLEAARRGVPFELNTPGRQEVLSESVAFEYSTGRGPRFTR